MNRHLWHRVLGAIATTGFLGAAVVLRSSGPQGAAPTVPQSPPEARPAEQVFKNIQVFRGMPADHLQGAMAFIASSLNVNCDYCHNQQDFSSDGLPAKARARAMILMVRNLNQSAFQGRDVVNCLMCHQGHTTPVSMSAVLPFEPPLAAPSGDHVGASLPSVAQILDDYVKALGGQAALDHVTSRVVTLTRLSGGSAGSTMELVQKGPAKALYTRQSPGYTLWVGFNGERAWAQDSLKSYWGLLNALQRNAILRDAELYQGSRLRSSYDHVIVSGRDKIGERETLVVAGTSPEGTRERFYFDAQTGLLLRRYIEEPTEFGWFPVQADFEDYRVVDGVQIPFIVRWSSARGAWGVRNSSRVLEVHDNVPIDDARFDHPPASTALPQGEVSGARRAPIATPRSLP